MKRVLIVYATLEGQSRNIAERAADVAREAGWEVSLAPVDDLPPLDLDPAGADALVFVASIHVGAHSPEAHTFVTSNRSVLETIPAAFVSVSLSAASAGSRPEAERYMSDFLHDTGWHPVATAVVAGALMYSQYGLLKRVLIRHIARQNGLPTDARQDHEFTDWTALATFLLHFLGAADEMHTA